jgi:hypothetical protein
MVYMVVGFVQIFAIVAGIKVWLGWGTVASFIGAIVTTYIPFAGQGLGIYGAVVGWDWPLIQAILLFGGPLLIVVVVGLFSND